jgi:protein tyrosine/serine phosphatase
VAANVAWEDGRFAYPSAVHQLPRVLAINGTRNLRDLGGYVTSDGRATRWRTVLRSAVPHGLDAEAQEEVLALGLRTIIDLRDRDEIERRPNVFRAATSLSYCWLPFWDMPLPAETPLEDLTRGYLRELDLRGERLAVILQHFARAQGLPALVHCAAGKDRTGVVVALLLAAVGVPAETIVEDYVLSRTCLGEQYLQESRAWIASRGEVWEDVAHLFDTPPERMQRTLDYLDRRFGGAERYLLDHGLTQHELQVLREALTCEPSELSRGRAGN